MKMWLNNPQSYRNGASPSDIVKYHTQDTPFFEGEHEVFLQGIESEYSKPS